MRTMALVGRVSRIAIQAAVCGLAMVCISEIAAADAAGTTASTDQQPQSAPKANLSWAIDPPASNWYLGPDQNKGAEFVVTLPAGSNVTSLRVTHSTILDSDTSRGVSLSAEHFHICPLPGESADAPSEFEVNCETRLRNEFKNQLSKPVGTDDKAQPQAARVALRLVVDKGIVPNGTFTGNLFIDTAPLTDTKTLQLTIQHTTSAAKGLGVVGLLTGVIVAWMVTVFARSRINRDQALLPVAVLIQKLQSINLDLSSIPKVLEDCVPDTQRALDALIADLKTSNLDDLQLLPSSLPAISPSTTQAGALQTFLQQKSQFVDNLDVIVTGIKAAGALAVPTLSDARLAALKTLVSNIDQFSAGLPQSSDALRTKIQTSFNTFNAVPQAQAAGKESQLLAMPEGSPQSAFQIRMEIQTITLLFWTVWGGLSVLTGFIALVMPTAGFGTIADYVRCWLWGFGLPVAGQGLQSLTMSSVNTQLGVTLPR